MEINRYESNGRMSKAVVYNGVIYLSGQVMSDAGEGDDIIAQTQAVLEKIDQLLNTYGSGKDKLLSALIHLKDISMWAEMNTVWDKWVIPGKEPVRTTVQAALAGDNMLVEITVTAAV